jgi:hypothetical protein
MFWPTNHKQFFSFRALKTHTIQCTFIKRVFIFTPVWCKTSSTNWRQIKDFYWWAALMDSKDLETVKLILLANCRCLIMATVDEDPRSRSNEIQQSCWMRAINWTHGLEGPRPKRGKLRLHLRGTFWRELVQTKKTRAKKESSWFEKQGKAQLKGLICFKWVQIGS